MNKKTFLFILFIFSLASTAGAQTNSELLLTWEARNYAPPEYLGKHLATPGSLVSVSAEVLAGGKLQDARRSSFSWYVDGEVFQKGIGLKEISFPVLKTRGDEYTIRAVTRFGGGNVQGVISIPVSRPEIVIQHPYQNNARVLPYFFTIPSPDALRVSWALDDVPQKILSAAEEFVFDSKLFQGRGVRVSARVTNPSRATEWREGMVRLNVR